MSTKDTNATGKWLTRDHDAVQHPGGHSNAPRLLLVRGEGALVWDADGRAYIDAHAGAWLTQVGHGRKELAAVAASQMEQLAHFTIAMDFANKPTIQLAEKLIARAPSNIGKARFMSSGSEADDEALQLVRLFHYRLGNPQRRKVMVHKGSFHGRSYAGAELAGGRPGIGGATPDVIQLTPPWPYHRELYGNADLTDYCVQELEGVIAQYGAHTIAAMFGELVMGPAGMVSAPDDYWPRMTQVLKQHGILFVADEVVTAFGRAGAWFTSNDYALEPDVIVLAKGIASGYMPVGALLLDRSFAQTVEGAGGGGSFAGHLVAAAVACANIDIIERENLIENSRQRGQQFLDELGGLLSSPVVGDVRGRGLMIGVELVADKGTRQSILHKNPALAMEIPRYAREKHGVILAVHGGAIALTPPLVITSEQVSRVCDAVKDVVASIKTDTAALAMP